MSIFPRKGSPYLWCRFMLNGQRYARSTDTNKVKQAQRFESELKAKILAGMVSTTPGKAPVLADFADRYLLHIDRRTEAGSLKPKTKLSYHNGCRLLSMTRAWKMRIDQIGRPTASELTFPGGPSNANQALRTLRAILGYAEELKIIMAAPRIDLREEEGRERLMAPWEEELILTYASPILRDILTIMLDCGMRPEEVCRMQWEDIRWTDNSILVQRGKSARARRHVGLTQRMREVLSGAKRRNEKRKQSGSPFVFPSSRSPQGHVGNLSQTWGRTLERVSAELKKRRIKLIPGLVPYSARHTYATNYLREGGDVGQLSRLMGHSDIRTTMRYVHLIEAGQSAQVMDAHNERKLEVIRSARG